MNDEKNLETVAEALGIDEEWSLVNVHRTKKWVSDSKTLSEAIEKAVNSVKTEEFGETTGNISAYEKKLILTGMHISQHTITKTLSDLSKFFGEMGEHE